MQTLAESSALVWSKHLRRVAAALVLVACGLSLSSIRGDVRDYQPQSGDLIFQVEHGGPSLLIQLSTMSPFNHVGIVDVQGQQSVVYEALGRVRKTPLENFLMRKSSLGHRYRVMRLKDGLTTNQMHDLWRTAKGFLGTPYDVSLHWSDDALNCSEYAWKVFARGPKIKLIAPKPIGERTVAMLIPEAEAAALLEKKGQRFAARALGGLDQSQPFVAPADLASSPLLETAWTNLPFESRWHSAQTTFAVWLLALCSFCAAIFLGRAKRKSK